MQADAGIRGDFYGGAYGPTVLLVLATIDDVRRLHGWVLRLAAGESPIVVLPADGVSIGHLNRFELRVVATAPDTHVRRLGSVSGLVWEATADEWSGNGWLLEPFLEGRHGHQYLADDPGEDAILVKVSFGEDYPSFV